MIKKILLGIAFILFGFVCIYVGVQTGWRGIDVFGLVLSLSGLIFAVAGYYESDNK